MDDDCVYCDGTGMQECDECTLNTQDDCDNCGGLGEIECPECDGTGVGEDARV